jgi:hypothetical protein
MPHTTCLACSPSCVRNAQCAHRCALHFATPSNFSVSGEWRAGMPISVILVMFLDILKFRHMEIHKNKGTRLPVQNK